jgi:hypothetical protein
MLINCVKTCLLNLMSYMTTLLTYSIYARSFLVTCNEFHWLSCSTPNNVHERWKKGVKLSLCFSWAPLHEGVLRSGGIAPRIPDLGASWRLVVRFTPRPLYPKGKSPWYPLDWRLGGPQSRSGCSGEEKNSQPCQDSNPRSYLSYPSAIIIQ